jgi:predicted secreted hydrolase
MQFPADHGAHPNFRIEWWYVTANLTDTNGNAYGVQWTLFRQASTPGDQGEGWGNRQVWMGHAAVTTPSSHHVAETFARGGVGQAGVTAEPFEAWIDDWRLRAIAPASNASLSPLDLNASGKNFSYALRLDADKPVVPQGDNGYSVKSESGQASYYYSQPFYAARGEIVLDGKTVAVTGRAWLDREWSSQPLSSQQTGWDWFSLHLASGDKVMLFRLRARDGTSFIAGNWIDPSGHSAPLSRDAVRVMPGPTTPIEGKQIPTTWAVAIPDRGVSLQCTPLNPRSWMTTLVAYWEGPIHCTGSGDATGYLEMTGY